MGVWKEGERMGVWGEGEKELEKGIGGSDI